MEGVRYLHGSSAIRTLLRRTGLFRFLGFHHQWNSNER
jgi:hypothetical protein